MTKLNLCLHKTGVNQNILVLVGQHRLTNQFLSYWNGNVVRHAQIRQVIQKPNKQSSNQQTSHVVPCVANESEVHNSRDLGAVFMFTNTMYCTLKL